MFQINKKRLIKTLVFTLEFLIIGIIVYLIALPFYPAVKYRLSQQGEPSSIDWQDFETVKQKTGEIIKSEPFVLENGQNNQEKQVEKEVDLPQVQPAVAYPASQAEYNNRVIIAKIGVNAPIIDSSNEDWALSHGAWRIPGSSSPDKAGNTVITGHRFKYLPPSNLTFYLFHKLEIGDIILAVWEQKKYYYKINEIKIVSPRDLSILEKTEKPTLTLFTCDPIYSQKNRLVIIAELIED
ncbi:sortase [Candidatus Parcubacteria bacterium]|nr:sortase [Candidatus Parcubacteria bacterium]